MYKPHKHTKQTKQNKSNKIQNQNNVQSKLYSPKDTKMQKCKSYSKLILDWCSTRRLGPPSQMSSGYKNISVHSPANKHKYLGAFPGQMIHLIQKAIKPSHSTHVSSIQYSTIPNNSPTPYRLPTCFDLKHDTTTLNINNEWKYDNIHFLSIFAIPAPKQSIIILKWGTVSSHNPSKWTTHQHKKLSITNGEINVKHSIQCIKYDKTMK